MSQIKSPSGQMLIDITELKRKSSAIYRKGKKMKKQDRNRLSKKDRRLIKKAMLKAAAKGSDEVYKIAPGLKDGFELLGKQPD